MPSNLRSSISSVSKGKSISAVVIDVLGRRCSVRLSGNGSLLTNISYVGKVPKKGDRVVVSYSSGTPVATTSDDNGNDTGPIPATQLPIPYANVAAPSKTTEDVKTDTNLDELYARKWIMSSSPLVTDDSSAGYSVLDRWINITSATVFVCKDDTVGAAVWEAEGTGSGGSPSGGSLNGFFVGGSLAIVDNASNPIIITSETTISTWYFYIRTPGASGSTIVDVTLKRVGEVDQSVFVGGTDNRPTIDFDDVDQIYVATPLVTDFLVGDILELNIESVAVGAADMSLYPSGSTGGGSGASLSVTDGVTTVTGVTHIVVGPQIALTDNGFGEIELNALVPSFISDHPDNPPTTPDSMDDEFEGSSLDAKWTSVISASSHAVVAVSGSRVILGHVAPYSEGYRHCDIWQTLPSGACTFRSKIAVESIGLNYVGIGMGIRASSTGRTYANYLMIHTGYAFNVILSLDFTGESVNGEASRGVFPGMETYFEIEITVTEVIFRHSTSGKEGTFAEVLRLGIAAIGTVDQIGILMHPYTTSSGAALGSCDWFRRTA